MSALDFMWNASQESDIIKLREQVRLQQKHIENLSAWVNYLNKELEKLKNEQLSKTRND